ncbi:MAG: hypothetical protein ABIH11_07415 [Candidatus Altiarchaeota archaeon]
MDSVKKGVHENRDSWDDGIKDMDVAVNDKGETVSEGITRLNTAIKKDKRKLRGGKKLE